MGLDLTAHRDINAVPECSREDAFDSGLLAFYEDEISPAGFAGLDLSVGYSYAEVRDYAMGNFRGVGSFYDVLAELSGAPGSSRDPDYEGPFGTLFQSREWLGPLDCDAIGKEFARYTQLQTSPSFQAIVARHEWDRTVFAEYLQSWHDAFAFAGERGAVNFH